MLRQIWCHTHVELWMQLKSRSICFQWHMSMNENKVHPRPQRRATKKFVFQTGFSECNPTMLKCNNRVSSTPPIDISKPAQHGMFIFSFPGNTAERQWRCRNQHKTTGKRQQMLTGSRKVQPTEFLKKDTKQVSCN